MDRSANSVSLQHREAYGSPIHMQVSVHTGNDTSGISMNMVPEVNMTGHSFQIMYRYMNTTVCYSHVVVIADAVACFITCSSIWLFLCFSLCLFICVSIWVRMYR